MSTGITVDPGALREFLTSAEQRIAAARGRMLGTIGAHLERRMKEAAPLKSGRLRNSIGFVQTGDSRVEVGVLRSRDGRPLVYGPIQEFGGTVEGKPWLAIPIGKGLKTKAGVGGIRARDVIANPAQAGVTSTFFARSKAGNLILFGTLGRTARGRQRTRRYFRDAGDGMGPAAPIRSSIVPLFVLKASVQIPGQHYIFGTYDREAQRIQDFVSHTVDEVING